MSTSGGSKSKGRKIGRMKESCKAYAQGKRLEKNKKRRMLRHLRGNPNDVHNAKVYIEVHGKESLQGLQYNSKGRWLAGLR